MTYIPIQLRDLVIARAGGACEYCHIPAFLVFVPHEFDHIVAEKHGGQTVAGNLAYSCAVCNRYKGTDLSSIDPETERLEPLFHPRRQVWSDHFDLINTMIVPKTPTGRVTAQLFRFNHSTRVEERRLLIEAGVFV